jgi:hypothetical protein
MLQHRPAPHCILLLCCAMCWRPAARLASATAAPADDDDGVCTIARVSAARLGAAEFARAYRHQQPVLLMGLGSSWPAHRKWSWEYLAEVGAGDGGVSVGSGAAIAEAGLAAARLPSLASFIREHVLQPPAEALAGAALSEPLYLFDPDLFQRAADPTAARLRPDVAARDLEAFLPFAAGGRHTGSVVLSLCTTQRCSSTLYQIRC